MIRLEIYPQAIAAAFARDQVQYHVFFITHSAHEVCLILAVNDFSICNKEKIIISNF